MSVPRWSFGLLFIFFLFSYFFVCNVSIYNLDDDDVDGFDDDDEIFTINAGCHELNPKKKKIRSNVQY